MYRRKTNIFVLILLGLAGFGFLFRLFTKPGSLLVQAGTILFFIGVFYFIYRLFLRRRMGGKEHSAYLRAVKQSKRRLKSQNQSKKTSNLTSIRSAGTKKATVSSLHKKRKSNANLTVIEGKKGKKKNRAFF